MYKIKKQIKYKRLNIIILFLYYPFPQIAKNIEQKYKLCTGYRFRLLKQRLF